MEQEGKCVKARLLAIQADGQYLTYVFQDLTTLDFIMCTKCPNWKGDPPELMQEGFLKYKFVVGGRDTYFDHVTGLFAAYQYTNTYFLDFVPITHVLRNGYVTNLEELTVVSKHTIQN